MNVLLMRYSPYWSAAIMRRDGATRYLIQEEAAAGSLTAEVRAAFAGVYVVSSFAALEELSAVAAALIATGVAIDAVVTATELTQYAAGYVAHLLGAGYPDARLIARTRDKRLMKQAARAAGVATARFRSVPAGRSVAETADAVEAAVGLPAVIKPANGWGSVSTVKVHDRAGLVAALTDPAMADELRSAHRTVEEFIDGEEFHVDAVWHDGRPWVFCVSRYTTNPLDLARGVGPNLSVLLDETDHAERYAGALRLHEEVNAALGLRRGATHLEFFAERGTGRLVFSEVASRMGGGCIPELVGAKVGVDEREVVAHELLGGELDGLPFTPAKFRYVGMLNLTPDRSGRITALPDRDELLARPNVLAASVPARGATEFRIGHTSAPWCVTLILGADSEAELRALTDRLTAEFPIAVDSPVGADFPIAGAEPAEPTGPA